MTSENPGLPVTTVTLRCRHQKPSSNLTADFHEGVLLFGSNSTGEVAIHVASKSDEGLYTCNMSDDGESPESRLADRGNTVKLAHQPSRFSAFIRDSLLHPANAAALTSDIFSCPYRRAKRVMSLLVCRPPLKNRFHHLAGASAAAAGGTASLWETQSYTQITQRCLQVTD